MFSGVMVREHGSLNRIIMAVFYMLSSVTYYTGLIGHYAIDLVEFDVLKSTSGII